MSRIPPGLLYLTIYNPTLSPEVTVPPDDEDAEEQAHILFYTARERAVSRDKILRQVGLAKALVNFSGMFSTVDEYANVHSQSRRMIMVSPEPDFWIHACVEIAKTPRQVAARSKGKGKGKELPTTQAEIAYDYHDGSIYDLALKKHVLRGYEQFNLTHGSFASILTSLGQQALELQLERFFTVWAWKWDIEDDLDFGDHLGVPLHPLHRSLTLLVDYFAQQHLPPDAVSFALVPPHVVPSSRLLSSRYPDALMRLVLSRIPPPPAPQVVDSAVKATTDVKQSILAVDSQSTTASETKRLDRHKHPANPFLNVDMRNLKWMWTGLTFGKTSSAKSTAPSTPAMQPTSVSDLEPSKKSAAGTPEIKVLDLGDQKDLAAVSVEVDTESLQDAISSENAHSPASQPSSANLPPVSLPPEQPPIPEDTTTRELDSDPDKIEVEQANLDIVPTAEAADSSADLGQGADAGSSVSQHEQGEAHSEVHVAQPEPPAFLSTIVHLAGAGTRPETIRRKVFHATSGSLTFAFVVDENHGLDLTHLSEQTVHLFVDMQKHIEEHDVKEDADTLFPTVTNILEKRNEHIISKGAFTSSSRPALLSKSEHLFRGQELLHSGLDISEVFSRGQNPQHWHISRLGLGTNSDGEKIQGEVFMEVARKESTLTDVDNELAGVVKRFGMEHTDLV